MIISINNHFRLSQFEFKFLIHLEFFKNLLQSVIESKICSIMDKCCKQIVRNQKLLKQECDFQQNWETTICDYCFHNPF